jgi:methionine biosynthesis protein MetW
MNTTARLNVDVTAQDRPDFDVIASWVNPGEKVLDLGCGEGRLLRHLIANRGVRGWGVELDDAKVLAAIGNGINLIQSDLERGLSDFEDAAFDHVILSQTLQAMRNTEAIVLDMLRVGRDVVVSFPNFGFWEHRRDILNGHMPVSDRLPYQWYDTPNIHLCTIADFDEFCAKRNIIVKEHKAFHDGIEITDEANFLASLAVYRITLKRD